MRAAVYRTRGLMRSNVHALADRPWGASAAPQLQRGVEALELGAGVGGGEVPLDGRWCGVAAGGPGGDLGGEGIAVGEAAVEALAVQHAELDFGDVEPGAMRRGVVELEAAGQRGGPGRRGRVREGGGGGGGGRRRGGWGKRGDVGGGRIFKKKNK